MRIIKPEDYGAVADGIINDAEAFRTALKNVGSDGVLLLNENSTYYIARQEPGSITDFSPSQGVCCNKESFNAAIELNGVKNLTIKGRNTTILIDNPLFYCNIQNTENVTVEGLNFDYRIRPFAGAKLIELDASSRTAVMQMDRSLYIEREATNCEFGVLERPDGRYHMFIESIAPIDKEKYVYKVIFSDDAATVRRLSMLKECILITPLPNFAHRIERAFSITGNTCLTMRNCNIYSMARFGFALFCNEGEMIFDNVVVKKAPNEKLCITGWRDCFHVKENHAHFLWKNCYAEYCYDDIFNISASTMNVNEVISESELDLMWGETKGKFPAVHVGDVVSFIDYHTGKDYGKEEISEIICQEGSHNIFRFKKPIKGIKSGENMFAYVETMVSPQSKITNCDFRGTFRFRGPIEIDNTHFYVKRFWIDLFAEREGPVPKGIHFNHCTFTFDDDHNKYFHIMAQREEAKENPQYHLEDIVFRDCKLPHDTLEIADSDKSYVKFGSSVECVGRKTE